MAVDSLSYLASAAGLIRVRQRESPVPTGQEPLRSQLTGGFRFAFGNAYLRAFLGEAASYNLWWQMAQTVLTLFAVEQLGMSAATLGLTVSVGAVGALAGSALTVRAAARVGLNRTVITAAVIGDLAPVALSTAQPQWWAAPLFATAFFLQGFGITACNVHVMTVRQLITPPSLLGRANAAYMLVAQGVKPVGALLAGWVGTQASPRSTLFIATLGLLSTSLFFIFSPVRTARTMDHITRTRPREPATAVIQ